MCYMCSNAPGAGNPIIRGGDWCGVGGTSPRGKAEARGAVFSPREDRLRGGGAGAEAKRDVHRP